MNKEPVSVTPMTRSRRRIGVQGGGTRRGTGKRRGRRRRRRLRRDGDGGDQF